MDILEVKNLSVKSPKSKKLLLENISFRVDNKSIFVLVGPNGSGKSTLAYSLVGLKRVKVVSGKIIFRGRNITKLSTDKIAKMGISLAFQEPAYFEGIKIKDFLRVGNKKISFSKAEKILSLVGLDKKFLDRDIDKTLSGGERKRIELASLMAMKPKLMILDEPDSGLDIIIYKELYDILGNIKEETGASIILITHREETGFIADKAGFLYKGKMLYEGNFRMVMKEYCQTVNRKKLCRKFKRE